MRQTQLKCYSNVISSLEYTTVSRSVETRCVPKTKLQEKINELTTRSIIYLTVNALTMNSTQFSTVLVDATANVGAKRVDLSVVVRLHLLRTKCLSKFTRCSR